MATEVIKTIKSSGGDYTSVSAAEAGEQRNLVTADEIAVLECYSFQDTAGVTINGFTTDATRYLKIYTPTAERHDGKWNSSKYRLEVSGTMGIAVRDEYVRIDGLQIQLTSSSGFNSAIVLQSIAAGGSDIRISNCIVAGVVSGTAVSRGIYVGDADITIAKIWNCIVYDFINGTNNCPGIGGYGGNVDIFNCTVYNCYRGILRQTDTVNVYNSAVFGNADDFNGTFATIDYCASDDGDGTNAVTPSDWDTVFEDITNRDFHLKSTDTDLIGAGTDDPGSGLFSDDIDAQARTSTWDIGADEFTSAAILLSASLSATGSQASSLTTEIKAKGTVSCAATVAAALTTAIVFAASVTASASQATNLSTSITMDASANAVAAQSSELTVLDIDLFDTAVTASAIATGELTTQISFSAAAAGSVTTVAAMTTQIQFDSALTATISLASGLTTSITVDSAVTGSCTAAGELTAPQQLLLAASPTGTAASSAALTTGLPIENVVLIDAYFTETRAAEAAFGKTLKRPPYFTVKKGKEVWF